MEPRTLTMPVPELWAGIECTLNRVQDSYNDQLQWSGHAHRKEDLSLIAELGVRSLRYPVLWERFAPDGDLDAGDWSWAEERLNTLRSLGIRPIVGLVHHGSGPRNTSLADSGFAPALAEYARRVAERFPWVQDWTPINEPVTTARFSGLYGHWYPHGNDEHMFARTLVNQCRAVVLAMREIRRVNPASRLIQTDDLGKTYATPHMAYQADFENERRWLGWDLLCGRVDQDHPLWEHLRGAGISPEELDWFQDNSCPPDILGIDHYLTSTRFLDERLEQYPVHLHGTNHRDCYADVEAVRILEPETEGLRGVLREAWNRYRLPMAVTEAHLGCTREEQMRWLYEVWTSALDVQAEGIDIRAVTSWAVLGAYDWNSLLTRMVGHYEPGVFDLRGGTPRPTALAPMLRSMASGETPNHPVLASPGWWHRPKRLCYRGNAEVWPPLPEPRPLLAASEQARPLLITGAEGVLGYAFARLCDHRGLAAVALPHSELDITDMASVEAAMERHRPWAVINAAGYTRLEVTSENEEHCFQVNTAGPAALATVCSRKGMALLTISSDQVFNGSRGGPFFESSPRAPRTIYGKSKARSEEILQEILPGTLIVRPGACFGPWNDHDTVSSALRTLQQGQELVISDHRILTPTYVPDLVHACLDLLLDGEGGIWHLTNGETMSYSELIERAAIAAGIPAEGIHVVPDSSRPARPRSQGVQSERAQLLQPFASALLCFLRDAGLDAMSMEQHRISGNGAKSSVWSSLHRFPKNEQWVEAN